MRHVPVASLLLILFAPVADAGQCETDKKKVDGLTHYFSPYAVTEPPSGYDHDRFGTAPVEIGKTFAAYFSNFDGPDDDNGDGEGDILAIPQFVAYQIDAVGEVDKHGNFAKAKTWKGPKPWYTDDSSELRFVKEQPDVTDPRIDKSYKGVGRTWNRGHLAMKLHTARLGKKAQCNSFFFWNAVPQAAMLNQGPWLDLEYWTGAAANRYGSVWVIAGPVFDRGEDIRRIGKPGRIPLAVPDAVFKIIARDGDGDDPPRVLAFIYPNHGNYRKCGTTSRQPFFGAYDHEPFMTSLAEVQEKTGLAFFSNLPQRQRDQLLQKPKASELWDVDTEHVPISCKKNDRSSYQPSKAEKEQPIEFPEGTTPDDLAEAVVQTADFTWKPRPQKGKQDDDA